MSITFRCPACGKRYSAADAVAGRRVRCKCGKELRLPGTSDGQERKETQKSTATLQSTGTAKQTEAIAVHCHECGKTYRANKSLLGKKLRCKCGAAVQVPAETVEANSPSFDNFLDEAMNESIAPPSSVADSDVNLRDERMQAKPEPSYAARRKRKKRPGSDMDVLATVTAVLCLIHGLAGIGSVFFMPRLIFSGHVLSLSGIISLCSCAVIVGIAAAGVGLLTRQTWALPVGSAAAIGYFAILGISLAMLVVAVVQSGSGLGLQIFVYSIPRLLSQMIAPGLLLHLSQRD